MSNTARSSSKGVPQARSQNKIPPLLSKRSLDIVTNKNIASQKSSHQFNSSGGLSKSQNKNDPTGTLSIKTEEEEIIDNLIREDRFEIKNYMLNLLQDMRMLRIENKKLRKENMLNQEVERTYREELGEVKREYKSKIQQLQNRNRELEILLGRSRSTNKSD